MSRVQFTWRLERKIRMEEEVTVVAVTAPAKQLKDLLLDEHRDRESTTNWNTTVKAKKISNRNKDIWIKYCNKN